MAWLLDPVETRLVAILEGARGLSGLGTTATERHIPVGRLRRSADAQSLRDPAYPIEQFDRAYELLWDEGGDGEHPENSVDPLTLRWLSLDLLVGHVYAVARDEFVAPGAGTTEVATASVRAVRLVAQSLAERIKRAVELPAIFVDATTDPRLVDCTRVGSTRIEDLGRGRLVSVTRYRVLVERLSSSNYDP